MKARIAADRIKQLRKDKKRIRLQKVMERKLKLKQQMEEDVDDDDDEEEEEEDEQGSLRSSTESVKLQ